MRDTEEIIAAAEDLFDNILGWENPIKCPYAPRDLWANLGKALYGENNKIVSELRNTTRTNND